MKKKKLKKKIKKLEKKVEEYQSDLSGKIRSLSDAYTNRFNKFNPSDIKNLNARVDGLCMDTNYLRSSIERINGRCDILDRRTQIDYDKIIPKTDETKAECEKTCDTCRWKPLMEQGGQDIPCMGCTADDKKMWKSKEN